jgi:PAS domain S-box-containing protein
MHAPPTIPSLVRRLVGRYLLFALAGLFSFLAVALVLAWRGQLTASTPLAVAAPLAILLVGGLILGRLVWINSQVEQQLLAIARAGDDGPPALRPIVDDDPVAVAWNRVRERLCEQKSLAELERALLRHDRGAGADFEPVLAALRDGIIVTDARGAVTVANAAAAAILGVPAAELTGSVLADRLASAFPERADDLAARLTRRLPQVVTEARRGRETAEGVVRIARSRVAGPPGTERDVWTLQDVTQQKLVEEGRNQFVLTATHELRTPLTNIKALAETIALEDDIDVEEQKRFCNMINTEATRLSRFVDDLLDLNQLEAGAMTVTRGETDLGRLLGEVVEHVRPEVERKRIDFAAALPPKYPKLKLDKDKFTGALVNLLGNAVKYTPEGGRVRLQVAAEEGELVLTVEDSGIGIAADELPRIFEKFYRSADERVRDVTGSGLGLAFTQEVVRRHGGRIAVSSELDKGSRFTVRLPLEREAPADV